MPKTYDLFGNPEDDTPDLPVNDNAAVATSHQLSVADQARQFRAARLAGKDIPPNFTPADMDPSFMGQTKAFARSVGYPTSGAEYLGANVRALKSAGKVVGGTALSTAKLAGGILQEQSLAPTNAIRLLFRHAPIANPMLDGSIHDMVSGQTDQFDQAKKDWEAGNTSAAIGHGAAAALPFMGPLAGNAGDKLFTEKSPEAIGELAGAAAIPGLTKMVGGADYAGKLTGAREMAADLGAKVSNSTLPRRTEFFRRDANPGRVIAPLGAKTMAEVPDLVTARVIEPTYTRLQSVLNTPAARTHSINIADSINKGFAEEIGKAENRADPAKIKRLEAVRDHHLDLAMQATNGTGIGEPAVAVAVKQGMGDAVDWTTSGDSVEGSVNGGLMGSYRFLDKAVDAAVPATKVLNQRLADGLTGRNAAKIAIQQDKMGGSVVKHATGLYSVPAAVAAVASGHPILGATIGGSALARSFVGRSMMAKGLSALGPAEAPLPATEPAPTTGPPDLPPDFGPGQDQPVFAAGNNDVGAPGGMGQAPLPMNPQAASMAPGYFGMDPTQIAAITDRAGAQSFAASPQIGSPGSGPQMAQPPTSYAADATSGTQQATPPIPQQGFNDAVALLKAGRISYQDFMTWMAQSKAQYMPQLIELLSQLQPLERPSSPRSADMVPPFKPAGEALNPR